MTKMTGRIHSVSIMALIANTPPPFSLVKTRLAASIALRGLREQEVDKPAHHVAGGAVRGRVQVVGVVYPYLESLHAGCPVVMLG